VGRRFAVEGASVDEASADVTSSSGRPWCGIKGDDAGTDVSSRGTETESTVVTPSVRSGDGEWGLSRSAALETSNSAGGMDLHDAEGNFDGINGAVSTRGRDSDKDSDRGVKDVHRDPGKSVLEGARRGTKDIGGIEHENREGSGSGLGLRNNSLSCGRGSDGGRAGIELESEEVDGTGGGRPGGVDTISGTSIVLGGECERVSRERNISGTERAGKHKDSGSALSAEGTGVDKTDDVSREESGSSDATASVRTCDVE
jgi:hypothetical protein